MKPVLLPLLLIAFLGCVSCEPSRPPPPVRVTDTGPVGEGLKVIGFCFLGAMVVLTVGRCFR
ncbi:hypothetical protein OVA24_06875 [Luteolibacter sp. SL250]|uniref:hypothetical protein n=1 Tax=Luteolibacter sp. SL250 TaxID=2995170 RepID=UPI00226EEEA1|nr:hypothetical protein [Luteolibacter sp. SL250]WAC21105.1 hypothetical protein OVA24_06875 [Luteolibacter sp. SL250]